MIPFVRTPNASPVRVLSSVSVLPVHDCTRSSTRFAFAQERGVPAAQLSLRQGSTLLSQTGCDRNLTLTLALSWACFGSPPHYGPSPSLHRNYALLRRRRALPALDASDDALSTSCFTHTSLAWGHAGLSQRSVREPSLFSWRQPRAYDVLPCTLLRLDPFSAAGLHLLTPLLGLPPAPNSVSLSSADGLLCTPGENHTRIALAERTSPR